MKQEIISVKNLSGECELPGDRNIALVSLVLGSIANGDSELKNFPNDIDCMKMIEILSMLGISIEHDKENKKVLVHGKGKNGFNPPTKNIDIGSSESLLKLLCGILAGQNFESTIEGSSYFSMVPMEEIIKPLKEMNANIQVQEEKYLPVKFFPAELCGIEHKLEIMDPWTKWCLMLAGMFSKKDTKIIEPTVSWDHMERLLPSFGSSLEILRERDQLKNEDEMAKRIRLMKKKSKDEEDKPDYMLILNNSKELTGASIDIPGDITMAANLAVAATILKKSEIRVKNICLNPTRNDSLLILKRMGADIEIEKKHSHTNEPKGDIIVKSSKLTGRILNSDEMINIIDEIPAIAVAASFAKGRTVIRKIERLRSIDSDCITALTENLRRMGVKAGELPDGLIINGDDSYSKCDFDSFNDSRIALSFSIAGLCCKNKSSIDNIDCINDKYPDFYKTLESLRSKD